MKQLQSKPIPALQKGLLSDHSFLYLIDSRIMRHGPGLLALAYPSINLTEAIFYIRTMAMCAESAAVATICRMVTLGYLRYDDSRQYLVPTGLSLESMSSHQFLNPKKAVA